QRRSAGEDAGVVLDDQVQYLDALLASPRHGLAEGARRIGLDEDPAPPFVGEGGTTRKGARCCALHVEVGAHERGQLGVEECASALGAERRGRRLRGYDDFLRRPYRRSKRSMRPPESTSFCL